MSQTPVPPFILLQQSFAEYLRDPENTIAPNDVDSRGLSIYRNAIIANTEKFFGDNFPKVKELLGDDNWMTTVRDYVRRHRPETPLFVELPGEFVNYLDSSRDDADDPPFLYELAHFELLENLVLTDEANLAAIPVEENGDLLKGVPIVNPTSQLVRYAFPVHKIDRAYQAIQPPADPTFILAFRDRVNEFKFLEISIATARVVEMLNDPGSQSGESVMRGLASKLGNVDIDRLIDQGTEILTTLRMCGAILGTRPEL